MRLGIAVTLCGLVALAAGPAALAVPINHGDYEGTNLFFQDVTEDSATDPLPLFEAPITIDDSLVFGPSGFASTASGLNGTDQTIGTLTTRIVAKPGFFVDQLRIEEFGDYTLNGPGGLGTSATTAMSLTIRIEKVDGAGIVPITILGNAVMTPSGGTYNIAEDGEGTGVLWSGLYELDITDAIQDKHPGGHATQVFLSFNNNLTTNSELGTSAGIQKKAVNAISITPIIPEPASLSLLALGGLVLLRRRRR